MIKRCLARVIATYLQQPIPLKGGRCGRRNKPTDVGPSTTRPPQRRTYFELYDTDVLEVDLQQPVPL